MARARNIKPSFFQNEELGSLTPLARLAFIGMWTIADYKGCIEYRPKRLKVQVLPYDECSIEEIVIDLERSGFVRSYSVAGVRYIKITNFEKHQNPHKNERETGSEIPDITEKDCEINELNNFRKNPEQNGTTRADSPFPLPSSPIPLPSSLLPQPDSLIPPSGSSSPALTPPPAQRRKAEAQDTPLQAACRETWQAYCDAYFRRYGTEPVRNAKVNSQVKQLCQALPHDEAPGVAAFYVGHNDAFYVRKGHDIGLLVTDAAKLRMEWATGRQMTGMRARQEERAGSMMGILDEIKRERGEA